MIRSTSRVALPCLALLALTPAAAAQLVHRYSFDGNGTTLTDLVGGADGTLMNGAQLMGTGALDLDGIDDYVDLPPGLASATEARSFEFWFTWSGGAIWQRLLDCGGNAGAGLTYFVISPRGSQPFSVGAIKTPSTPQTVSTKVYSTVGTPVGALTHVCVTYDSAGDSMKIYLDGAFEAETTLGENLSELDDLDCWLGRSHFGADPYYLGAISEFRIYGDTLTAAEVAASFAAGPDGAAGIGTRYCQPAALNSTGVSGAMGATGSASVANNNLVLEANDLPNNAFGFFLTSRTQGLVMNPGGSQGNLCLGGSIGRYVGSGQIQNSGATGAIRLAVDLTQHPTPTGLVSVAPGETWSFQAWHRDSVSGTATSNFTDGLEITFQ